MYGTPIPERKSKLPATMAAVCMVLGAIGLSVILSTSFERNDIQNSSDYKEIRGFAQDDPSIKFEGTRSAEMDDSAEVEAVTYAEGKDSEITEAAEIEKSISDAEQAEEPTESTTEESMGNPWEAAKQEYPDYPVESFDPSEFEGWENLGDVSSVLEQGELNVELPEDGDLDELAGMLLEGTPETQEIEEEYDNDLFANVMETEEEDPLCVWTRSIEFKDENGDGNPEWVHLTVMGVCEIDEDDDGNPEIRLVLVRELEAWDDDSDGIFQKAHVFSGAYLALDPTSNGYLEYEGVGSLNATVEDFDDDGELS
ncbi:MAG: hypothetical protein KAW09_12105, partial [Thermoplasmata archaeon]|nr:hypothetical protein [Thermoplasmata archaeon]